MCRGPGGQPIRYMAMHCVWKGNREGGRGGGQERAAEGWTVGDFSPPTCSPAPVPVLQTVETCDPWCIAINPVILILVFTKILFPPEVGRESLSDLFVRSVVQTLVDRWKENMASRLTIYSSFKDISTYFKISLIQLEISIIHFEISLIQLKISLNHVEISQIQLKIS